MDMVERYVNDVRTFLPKAQQDDIVSELSENLHAEIDDREEELGRPLTDAEQEELLRRHGHPMLMAGRYQTNQGSFVFGRTLVGNGLFPFYIKALWLVIGISLAIHVVVLVALAIAGNPSAFDGARDSIMFQVVIQFLIITGVFVGMEQALPTMRWSADRSAAKAAPKRAPKPKKWRVSRVESAAQIIVIGIMIAWLRVIFEQPSMVFGPAAKTYQLAPIWSQIALPTVLMLSVSIAQAVVNLVRPDWVRLRTVVRLGTGAAWLVILSVLLHGGEWIVLTNSADDGGATLHTINEIIYWSLLSTLIGSAIGVLIDAWTLIRDDRRHAAQVAVA